MKYFKIVIINLLLIAFIVITADFLFFEYIKSDYQRKCVLNGVKFDNNVRYKIFDITKNDTSTTNIYKYFLEDNHYKIVKSNSQNSPVIVLGDSYVWMNDEKGFCSLLSQNINRTVYNFSYWGWGTQHMYYLLNNPLFYSIISNNSSLPPEYAIYVYIRDHKNRLTSVMDYFLDTEPYLNYIENNGKILKKEYNYFNRILYRFFTYRYIKHKFENVPDDYAYNMIYKLIIESSKKLKAKYPDIKFIVLEYYQDSAKNINEELMFKKLQKDGIIYISTKELTKENLADKKYTIDDGYHPNEAAWALITPKLGKLINCPNKIYDKP